MKKKISTSFIAICCWMYGIQAQQTTPTTLPAKVPEDHAKHANHAGGHGEEHSMKGSHRFTLGLGHTHVSQGIQNGDRKWLALASWSFNYDYWIAPKWALGLQTDLIVESFKVEHGNEEILERAYPIALVPVGMFKPGKHFTYILGAGTEVAGGHAIGLTRLGLEYGKHLPKDWEIGAALVWDNKWGFYNSWGIAFTVSKIWPKKHKS